MGINCSFDTVQTITRFFRRINIIIPQTTNSRVIIHAKFKIKIHINFALILIQLIPNELNPDPLSDIFVEFLLENQILI